jgi:hypothetical protein
MPTPQQPSILMQMMEASQTCRDLMGLMIEENAELSKHSLTESEARLALKKRLALRLEKLLADIKAHKGDWRGNTQAENVATMLAHEIEGFRKLAQKNEVMLRAAHALRADIVAVIRDTIEARQPRVTTYGSSGTVSTGNAGTTVLATTV